jgi:hypothetical protein
LGLLSAFGVVACAGKYFCTKKGDGFGVRQHVVAFHRRQQVAADRWLFICADLNQKKSYLRARRVKSLTRFFGEDVAGLRLYAGSVGRQLVADHKSGDMSPHSKGDRRFAVDFEEDASKAWAAAVCSPCFSVTLEA